MPDNRTLEICCGDLDSVAAAISAGANRIELCAALDAGGITPSWAMIRHAVSMARDSQQGCKVHVLVRPRPGDFIYSHDEGEVIIGDVEQAFALGADGVVVGALNSSGHIDRNLISAIMHLTQGRDVTFHRAFDLCADPDKALPQLIELGLTRLLSSGCAPTAEQGIDTLRRLNQLGAGRIAIMAGAGVTPANAAKILDETGLSEIHASARKPQRSVARFRRDGVAMGAPGSDEYLRMVTNASYVRKLLKAINS